MISGTLETYYFEFRLQDLINFIGFSTCDRKLNVENFLDQFIDEYQYKELRIKFEEQENSKIVMISQDALMLGLMRLHIISAIKGQIK